MRRIKYASGFTPIWNDNCASDALGYICDVCKLIMHTTEYFLHCDQVSFDKLMRSIIYPEEGNNHAFFIVSIMEAVQ